MVKIMKTTDNGNPHSLLVRLQTGTTTLEVDVENSQKAKYKLPYDLDILRLDMHPKAYMLIQTCAILFMTSRKQKQSKSPSSVEWMMEKCYIHNGLLFGCKKNEICK